jgi:hypothetical protein
MLKGAGIYMMECSQRESLHVVPERTTVFFSGGENHDELFDFVKRKTAEDGATGHAEIGKIVFLGFPPSVGLSRLNHRLCQEGFGVATFTPEATKHVRYGDADFALVIVNPIPIGIVALARIRGFYWREYGKDVDTLLGKAGTEAGNLTPAVKNLLRLFELRPPTGANLDRPFACYMADMFMWAACGKSTGIMQTEHILRGLERRKLAEAPTAPPEK